MAVQLCLWIGKMKIDPLKSVEMLIGPSMLLFANTKFREGTVMYADLPSTTDLKYPKGDIIKFTSEEFYAWFMGILDARKPLLQALKEPNILFRVSTGHMGPGGAWSMSWPDVDRGEMVAPKDVRKHEKPWPVPQNEVLCLCFGSGWIRNYLQKLGDTSPFSVIGTHDLCCSAHLIALKEWAAALEQIPSTATFPMQQQQPVPQEIQNLLTNVSAPIADCLSLTLLTVAFGIQHSPQPVNSSLLLPCGSSIKECPLAEGNSSKADTVQTVYNTADYSRYFINKGFRKVNTFLASVNLDNLLAVLSSDLDTSMKDWQLFQSHWLTSEEHVIIGCSDTLQQLLLQLPEKYPAAEEEDYSDYTLTLQSYFDFVPEDLVVAVSKRVLPINLADTLTELLNRAISLLEIEAAEEPGLAT